MISLHPISRPAEARFYDVLITKLIVLWLGTFGFYHFYWHYKQWSYEEDNGADVTPWARAMFAPFYAYSLFTRIDNACERNDTSSNWSAALLAILYFIGIYSFKMGGHTFWAVGYLSFLPLIPVQLSVNQLNRRVAPDVKPNTRFTALQIVVLCLSLLVLAWVVFAAVSGFGR